MKKLKQKVKKPKLNKNRIGCKSVTPNHEKITLFNFELDYSFGKLFAITYLVQDKKTLEVHHYVYCRELQINEKHRSGVHFNKIEPRHKLRLPRRDWQAIVNNFLGHVHLYEPEVLKVKGVKPCKKS
jgi:hypothetical protein